MCTLHQWAPDDVVGAACSWWQSKVVTRGLTRMQPRPKKRPREEASAPRSSLRDPSAAVRPSEESPDAEVTRAWKIIEGIVEAVTWHDSARLQVCLNRLAKVPFSPAVAAETGICRVLADHTIWRRLGDHQVQLAASVELKWRTAVRQYNGPRPSRALAAGPAFGGATAEQV